MKKKNYIRKLHFKTFFRIKLTEKEMIECIISKQLKPFNKTYFDVLKEDDWFSKYEVTAKENDKWVEWGIKFLKNNSKNSLISALAEKEMRMINLQWGLKIKGGYEAVKNYEAAKKNKNGEIHNKK